MPRLTRLASSLLFTIGVVVVFTGLTAALGFTITGILASVAVVAALLYAGAVWFGAGDTLDPAVHVFDRELKIVVGVQAGQPVALQFPETMRPEIERRCALAISGQHSHFVCLDGERERRFDAAPVLAAQPSGICGVLIEGARLAPMRVTADPALNAV